MNPLDYRSKRELPELASKRPGAVRVPTMDAWVYDLGIEDEEEIQTHFEGQSQVRRIVASATEE